MQRKTLFFGVVAVVLTLLDQATKWWIRANLCLQPSRFCEKPRAVDVFPGWFQIVHVENRGAAFGMLNSFEHRMWVFLIFTIVAVVLLTVMYLQLESDDVFLSTTLGLILSGALGNGIDRVDKQAVTDFLRFYVDNPEWKARLIQTFGTNEYLSFNVADMAICIGVGLLFIHYLFLEDREEVASAAELAEDDAPSAEAEGH